VFPLTSFNYRVGGAASIECGHFFLSERDQKAVTSGVLLPLEMCCLDPAAKRCLCPADSVAHVEPASPDLLKRSCDGRH